MFVVWECIPWVSILIPCSAYFGVLFVDFEVDVGHSCRDIMGELDSGYSAP